MFCHSKCMTTSANHPSFVNWRSTVARPWRWCVYSALDMDDFVLLFVWTKVLSRIGVTAFNMTMSVAKGVERPWFGRQYWRFVSRCYPSIDMEYMDNHIRKPNQDEWRGNATDVYSGDVPFEAQPGHCLVWQVFGVFFRITFGKKKRFTFAFVQILCYALILPFTTIWSEILTTLLIQHK
jgi:hypothetical protein